MVMDGTRKVTIGDLVYVKAIRRNKPICGLQDGKPVVRVGEKPRALDPDQWEPLPILKVDHIHIGNRYQVEPSTGSAVIFEVIDTEVSPRHTMCRSEQRTANHIAKALNLLEAYNAAG